METSVLIANNEIVQFVNKIIETVLEYVLEEFTNHLSTTSHHPKI